MVKKIREISIDNKALYLIGILSLGYCLFNRTFAQLHLSIPFLDFPIFIGEIFLFLCLILLFIKWKKTPLKLKSWHYLLFSYFVFVVVKAFWGYFGPSKWGPLAFRHAALFYYPLFAVFGYTFFNRDFFSKKKILFLSVFFIVMIIFPKINIVDWHHGYLFICFLFAGAVIKAYPFKRIRNTLFFLLLMLLFARRELIFSGSRTQIVANAVSIIYFLIVVSFILKVKKSHKVLMISIVAIILFMAGSARMRTDNNLGSLKYFAPTFNLFDEYVEVVSKKESRFVMEKIEPKLYQKEWSRKEKLKKEVSDSVQSQKMQASDEKKQLHIEEVQAKFMKIQEGIDQVVFQLKDILSHTKSVRSTGRFTQIEIEAVQLKVQKAQDEIQKAQQLLERAKPQTREASLTEKNKPFEITLLQLKIKGLQPKIKEAQDKIQEIQYELKKVELEKEEVQLTEKEKGSGKVKVIEVDLKKLFSKVKEAQVETEIVQSYVEKTQAEIKELKQMRKLEGAQGTHLRPTREIEGALSNFVLRLLIWRDMLLDLKKEGPILGFDFGKPFRSKSVEILRWSLGDWHRDGWIASHNSYLNMLYRGGIVGILYILTLLSLLVRITIKSIKQKSITGILLSAILVQWLGTAFFLIILELPYSAIPFWSLFGMTLRYCSLPSLAGRSKA